MVMFLVIQLDEWLMMVVNPLLLALPELGDHVG
jgi:hypothetical protein